MQRGIEPLALAAVMHSEQWTAHSTADDKIYYVDTMTKGTMHEKTKTCLVDSKMRHLYIQHVDQRPCRKCFMQWN